MKRIGIVLVCCAACVVAAAAQAPAAPAGQAPGRGPATPPPANLVEEVQRQYASTSGNSVKAAENFPEDHYKWQPTPDVRTWAQLVAHMTDDANNSCWMMAGMAAAPARVETGATPAPNDKPKATLLADFKAAVDTCHKAIATLTPANMLEPSGGRGGASKIGVIVAIAAHTNEHYGNMVTYMRLQGCTPPSSQRGAGPFPACTGK